MSKSEKEKKIAKRLAEYNYWIKKFKEQAKILLKGKKLVFINNAALILNYVYWALVENYVRPHVDDKQEPADKGESNISRFKIISTTELAIMRVRPIVDSEEETERILNALFAYYTGITILRSYNSTLKENSFEFIDKYKGDFESIHHSNILSISEEHIQWLAYLDTRSEMPILSNAQTWRLFNLCLLALENKLHETTTNLARQKNRGRS